MTAVAEGTLGRWFTDAARHRQPGIIAHAREMILATSGNGYRGCAEAIKTLDYRRRLPQLKRTRRPHPNHARHGRCHARFAV